MKKPLVLTVLIFGLLMAAPFASATVIDANINTNTNVGTVNATSNLVVYYDYPANSSTSNNLNGTVLWLNTTSYLNVSGRQSLGSEMGDANEQGNQGENNGTGEPGQSNSTGDQNSNDSSQGQNNTTGDQGGNNSSRGQDQNDSARVNTAMSPSPSNVSQLMPALHIVNATLTYHIHAFANQTNLTIYRNLTLHISITNITKKVGKNTTIIDMSWRAFGIQGQMMSHFKGGMDFVEPGRGINEQSSINTNMDVNKLGNIGNFSQNDNRQGNETGDFQLSGLLGSVGFGQNVMNYNTLNFSVFSTPLNQWARVYNSATNSTTFYYNATSNENLNYTSTDNGSTYSFKLFADPHASLSTTGDATPTSANTLSVAGASSSGALNGSLTLTLVAVVVLIVVVSLIAIVLRKRKQNSQ